MISQPAGGDHGRESCGFSYSNPMSAALPRIRFRTRRFASHLPGNPVPTPTANPSRSARMSSKGTPLLVHHVAERADSPKPPQIARTLERERFLLREPRCCRRGMRARSAEPGPAPSPLQVACRAGTRRRHPREDIPPSGALGRQARKKPGTFLHAPKVFQKRCQRMPGASVCPLRWGRRSGPAEPPILNREDARNRTSG